MKKAACVPFFSNYISQRGCISSYTSTKNNLRQHKEHRIYKKLTCDQTHIKENYNIERNVHNIQLFENLAHFSKISNLYFKEINYHIL